MVNRPRVRIAAGRMPRCTSLSVDEPGGQESQHGAYRECHLSTSEPKKAIENMWLRKSVGG